ncbi:MAG: amidohydrolase [Spirochaetales bacterium]|nr:amidohydrolase [Spirochaetales bacterium]
MDKGHLDLAIGLRHELHRHPELSGGERWTKQRLIDFLKQNTALEIVDRGRWFYARYPAGEGRPSVAFRADFDGLPMEETIDLPYASRFPGVAHKCGHDGHSASLAALALEINKEGAEKNVYFVFQHAEETVEGALECAPLMDEAGISEIFAYHNVPGLPKNSIAVMEDTAACGSTGMIISLTGVPAHASQPEDGRNPCFAIGEIIQSIPELTDPAGYKGLAMCTVVGINAGQEAFGMAASEGRLLLTIRSQFDHELETLRQKIENKTRDQAARYGLEYEVSLRDRVPAAVNHGESAGKVRRAAKRLGLTLLEGDSLSRGSEDFAWFTQRTRGALFWLGAGEDRAPIHTPRYDFNDEIIPAAVDMFKALLDE